MRKTIATVFAAVFALAASADSVSNLVKTLTWCSLGTSITDFNDNPIDGRTQGYQFYVMDKLGWNHDKLLNVGHSGSIVGVANDFPKDTPYDIYTIEFGINDWGTGHPVGTMDDYENYLWNNKAGAVRWNLFAACYRNVIETIRAANPNAIIVLTTPRKGYGFNGTFPDNCEDLTLAERVGNYYSPDAGTQVDGEQTYLEDYAKLIRQIATVENLVLCDWYAYAATQDNLASLSVDVAVHPNDAGYEIMADLLAPKILEAVAAAGGDGPPASGSSVTLNANGGTVSSTTVELPAESLPTPTREGYHFVGWFKDEIVADTAKGYVRGTYLCGEPLTTATVDDKDKTLYAKWVKNDVYNHFHGKKVVFLGDSVTTLYGFAAKDRQVYTANIYYTEDKSTANGITEKNTWWGQLVQALDMDLLSVNAVSGSPVVDKEASITYDVRAMSGATRIADLNVNGAPDVIFIFGGINDFNGNTKAAIDDFDPNAAYLTGDLDLTSDYFPSFAEGYATMIRRLRHSYPEVEIVAIAPYYPNVNKDTDAVTIASFDKGAQTIADLCDYFDVPHLDLRETQLPYWQNGVRLVLDQVHPNQAGFTEFANYVLENYEPACAHANKTALAGAVAATCTTVGYSGDCTCVNCGKEFPGHVIPKLGHVWSEWIVTKDPTKTETGYREHTCQREGCGVTEGEVIPKIVDVVALRNVAVATAVTTAPTLPAKVAGLKADGTLGDEYEVKWNPVEAPTEEGVTTVTGAATVNGKVMTVTASIRAAEADSVNLSSSANSTTESNVINGKINSNNKLKYLTTNAADPLATGTWDDVICYGNVVEVTIEWPSEVTVTKVKVYFNGTTGNYMAPKNVMFYKGDGFSAEIAYDEGGNDDFGGDTAWHEYVFKAPQTLSKIKFYQQSDKTNANKMLFLRRLWVLGVGSVEHQTTDTLTTLEVDGAAVTGFAPEILGYKVIDGQAITKAENGTDNVAVTILPKCEDKAYAVTLAEDGESTKAYTVSMPKSHDHTFGEWQVMTPATVYASGLRRRVCTYDGCKVYEEEVIPQIERKSVTWINVDFANYTDGSTIADGQVDQVNGGTWSKPSADDTATVVRGDVNAAALAVTNNYLCYAAKRQTSAGRDATVRFKAKFQKPNTDALPEALDLGQTAVFVFPKGKTGCYKAYTADGWVELVGATPDFDKFVTITIEFRYNDGGRSAMVKIDDVVCTPTDAETPWFALAGSATQLTSVGFFGELGLGNFWGECLTPKTGLIFLFQ